jgi:hypothetical protein
MKVQVGMADLTSLSERVEGAGGPNLALEAEIWCAVNGYTFDQFDGAGIRYRDAAGRYRHEAGAPPPYTASLDAALGLVDRVLPGAGWQVETIAFGSRYGALVIRPHEVGYHEATAATPALALISALLKALSEKDQANG